MGDTVQRNDLPLPVPAGRLLPHRPPMLFVDQLVEWENERAVGTARLPVAGIGVCDGNVVPELFIELIAQTAAMGSGYEALCQQRKVLEGMLVGLDRLHLCQFATPGSEVLIVSEKTFEFGMVKVIRGTVHCGDVLLAEGEMKVWENVGNKSEG